MMAFFDYIQNLPLLELTAMTFALIYVVLAAKGSIWCWPAAFFSTALYTYIFYDVLLLMDSLLNIYYLAMAVYGYWIWKKNAVINNTSDVSDNNKHLNVISWQANRHIKICLNLTVISFILGYVMATYTPASFPYIDTFTTVFAVFATYLVTQKVLENWIYWFVIDFVSIFIYLEKDLQPTAVLFVIYVFITIYGYIKWRSLYQQTMLADTNLTPAENN